uniref:Novel STAND NTPase 6 domain-containing protein n=1 Tax=Branchiostoma floridae TaxID=7739 RepID=C3XXC4_BRAFL|eukprot:XP_002611374.1 hypothetical protein BRAFLDRAFT_73230 [Branchiostoma floridae]
MADLWARIQAQKASLLRDLKPRHLLNELLQHGVLDDDEYERVKRAGVTRDSLTVAWDQIDAVPGGSVEVSIFAHGNDQEPVLRGQVGWDQTDVSIGGLRAGTKYDARVRVVSGQLRGPEVIVEAETSERCLYPKYILDITTKNRPHLFGREEDITNLTMILEKDSVCLVSGLSGVGKTAMVKEYVYRNSNNYKAGIVWMTSKEQVNFLFVNVLREVDNRDPIVYDYRDKSFDWAAEYLSKTLLVRFRGKFLFVFDNVETSKHASDMLKIVPDRTVHGVTSHVILLSRRELSLPDLDKLTTFKLHPLSVDAALRLYLSQLQVAPDVDLARADIFWPSYPIVTALGYLPYAIIHYCIEANHGGRYAAGCSEDLLLNSLISVRLDLSGYGQSENPIIDEVRKVQEECPKAYELLAVLSFFDHTTDVPLCVFKGSEPFSWQHPNFKGESYYDMAQCLKKHSLIKVYNRPCGIALNRIVSYSVLHTLDSVSRERFFWTALEISVRAVERLRQLSLTCPHNNDSPDCSDFTKGMFWRVLVQSCMVSQNSIDSGVTVGRCYAVAAGTPLSCYQHKSVSLANPALNISSWPVNLTARSRDDKLLCEYKNEYRWPITPMGNGDGS